MKRITYTTKRDGIVHELLCEDDIADQLAESLKRLLHVDRITVESFSREWDLSEDLNQVPPLDLPGMWEEADFMGGQCSE